MAWSPVSVRIAVTGLEIRNSDGLLLAFWRTSDLRAAGTLPGGGAVLACVGQSSALLELPQAGLRDLAPADASPPVQAARRPVWPWLAVMMAALVAAATAWSVWAGE